MAFDQVPHSIVITYDENGKLAGSHVVWIRYYLDDKGKRIQPGQDLPAQPLSEISDPTLADVLGKATAEALTQADTARQVIAKVQEVGADFQTALSAIAAADAAQLEAAKQLIASAKSMADSLGTALTTITDADAKLQPGGDAIPAPSPPIPVVP